MILRLKLSQDFEVGFCLAQENRQDSAQVAADNSMRILSCMLLLCCCYADTRMWLCDSLLQNQVRVRIYELSQRGKEFKISVESEAEITISETP